MKKKKQLTQEDLDLVNEYMNKHDEKNVTFFLPIHGYKTCSIGKIKLINMIRKYKSFEKLEMEINKYVEKNGADAVLIDENGQLTMADHNSDSIEYNVNELKRILGL